MGSRMKVLGVAPYEGMQSLMYKVAEEFPDIELSVFLGDLAAGVAVVQERMQENYDIVISRGGTAGLLRQQISIPVVEISFTVYDILPVLRLADVSMGRLRSSASPASPTRPVRCKALSRVASIFSPSPAANRRSPFWKPSAHSSTALFCATPSPTPWPSAWV